MLAITIPNFGGPEALTPAIVPDPVPAQGELLIEVQAAGVARADTLQRQGKYPPPPGASEIPGLDVAGTVLAIGEGVRGWKLGDRVCAILAGGGYAERCSVPAEQVLPIPENWSFIEAATLPENLLTVYDNLITRAALHPGESILIHGGTSGIGTMAVMLSRAWKTRVFATAGSEEKCRACVSFGADYGINYKEQDFVHEIGKLTDGRGVDVILDMVGGPYLARNLHALAIEGRLAILAIQGGRHGELDIATLMHKRARILASTMRARTPKLKGEVVKNALADVWPLLPAKTAIRPIIDSTFPLEEAALAHARMDSGEHIGKIILTCNQGKESR
jgi:NADPH:quinone reductase